MANLDPPQLLTALAGAFSPSAPIDQQALFSGRISQLIDVINAVNQKGQHAILYGERGVGKTSLARVLASLTLANDAMVSASINCDPQMTFSGLWQRVAREITFQVEKPGLGFSAEKTKQVVSAAGMLPEVVTPDDVRYLFARLPKALVVIDELDRLEDFSVTELLADTIKTLSDHAIDVTILLVGVADSVDSLIKEHGSVERALVQIRMPRMSPPELHEILVKGYAKASMTIVEAARNKIASLSQGLPHYTHLLGLYAGQRAAAMGVTEVQMEHVRTAIDQSLSKAQQSIIGAYHRATASPQDNLYCQVLLACALAPQDNIGTFAAVDVRGPLTKIMGKHYDIPAFAQHLNKFCEADRGPILRKSGTARRYRFRFENPLMQPFVIMDGIKRSMITDADIGR